MHFITSIKRKESEEIKLLSCLSFNRVFRCLKVLPNLHILLQVAKDRCIYSTCMNTCLDTDQWVKESKTMLFSIASSDQVEPYEHFLEIQFFFSANTLNIVSLLCWLRYLCLAKSQTPLYTCIKDNSLFLFKWA